MRFVTRETLNKRRDRCVEIAMNRIRKEMNFSPERIQDILTQMYDQAVVDVRRSSHLIACSTPGYSDHHIILKEKIEPHGTTPWPHY